MFGRFLNSATMNLLNNSEMRGSLPIFLKSDFIITWCLDNKLKMYL
jgi:hypothetical protein